MSDNKMFTEEEVNKLTNGGYEEEMVWLFTSRLNDVLENEKYVVCSNLRMKLATVFANDKLRSLLDSAIQLCEMAEFKMDSYSEFGMMIDDLFELHQNLI